MIKLNVSKYSNLIRVFAFIVYCSCSKVSMAQTNLVPNSSFEQYTSCPNNSTLADENNSKPDIWYKPDIRGAGYLNACAPDNYSSVPYNLLSCGASFQYARTGVAYILITYFFPGDTRDYFQIKLLDSLRLGKKYYGEYYVNLVNCAKFICNNQAMLFTKTAVYVDTNNVAYLPASPQIVNYDNKPIGDTLNWVKVSGIFTAQGGEQYLTLGSFKKNNQTIIKQIQPNGDYSSGYYVDDVAVYALDSFNLHADAGRDTTITIGDSVFIGSYTNGIDTLQWQIQNTGQKIDSTRPGFWVKPLVNTCYVLTQTVNGYTSSDTVCVTVKPLPLTMSNYQLVMSNEKQVLNKWETMNEINVSHYNVTKSIDGINFKIIGKVKAENKILNNYSFIDESVNDRISYYRIVGVDNDGRKSYSVIRNLELGIGDGVSVFPNPARDYVNVVGKDIKEVRLINCLGQQIATVRNLRNNAIIINTKNFNKGLYIVQVILTNGTTKNEKIVVE